MKSTTSKIGIGIVTLAMMGIGGCSKYNICEPDSTNCKQYNSTEFEKKFNFDPGTYRQVDEFSQKICIGNYCEQFSPSDIEVVINYGIIHSTKNRDFYVICFDEEKTDCTAIKGNLLDKIQKENAIKNKSKTPEKKIENRPTSTKEEKLENKIASKDSVTEGDYTITDVQLGIIPYKHKDEDCLKGVIPFKYITAKNRDETKVFVYVSNDNVRNGVAKLQISESPNGSIITLNIVKKQVDRFHEPIQTKLIKADGTIHSIKYNL
ncbi:hypothetical protein HN814_01900 [Candidatus Woesearchaeota archaeon]|nr:hypothetical protein [Candidatus Woesearchaeota archaeon]